MTDIVEEILKDHGSDIIVHYGVPGMRWGHVKEDISTARTTHKQKKAAKREQRASAHDTQAVALQKRIDEIKSKPRSRNLFTEVHRNNQINEFSKARDTHQKAAKDIRAGHLTDYQKKILIGAGVTAGVLAAYGTYKFVDSGHAHAFRTKDIPFKKNDALSRKMSSDRIMSDIVKHVNPGFGERGTVVNCRRCTFAYEMRRRGFDVQSTHTFRASGQSTRGLEKAIKDKFSKSSIEKVDDTLLQTDAKKWFSEITAAGLGKHRIDLPSGDKSYFGPSKAIFDALKTQPDGARGELGSIWKMGGAHSMAWEIIDGVPHVFDTQTGTHYSEDTFTKIAFSMRASAFTRLDNVKLDTNFVRRWVTNVG